ncbi:MAG: phosphoglycolate phosphatase [Gammaproteobacteria bacterium]
MQLKTQISAVLFDLDGTLLDTAPDMVACLHQVCINHGREPVAFEKARSYVSTGALGLLKLAFPEYDEVELEELRPEYLEIYARNLNTETALFDSLDELLEQLEDIDLPWGIVTNKPGFLTMPLLEQLRLADRCACIVSGDTLPERKPHPAPLQHAARIISVNSETSVYIGDAANDIAAGKAAGMKTIAAAYGYVLPQDDAANWQADALAAEPGELLECIEICAEQ